MAGASVAGPAIGLTADDRGSVTLTQRRPSPAERGSPLLAGLIRRAGRSRCSPSWSSFVVGGGRGWRRRRATTTRSSSTTAGRTTATSRSSRTSRRPPASSVELRGGTGPELFERLEREGADTPADVLVTTDLANLWRAEDAGLLAAVDQRRRSRPTSPRRSTTPGASGGPLTTRLRVPVVVHRARRRRRGHQLRVPRRSAVRRAAPACARRTASTTSRSSPT